MQYSMKKLTNNQQLLTRKLIEVWKDKDFVKGIVFTLKGEDEVLEMLDFVESKNYERPSDITAKALYIAEARNNIPDDDFYSEITKMANSIK